MTEILTADYRSESTEDLIRRAEMMMGGVPITGPIESIQPIRLMNAPAMGQIRTLAPACNRIEVKNVINIIDAGIVTCTGPATITCGAIPGTCPSVDPTTYVNMVAMVDALVAQNGVTIRFEYLLNDVPTTTDIIVNLTAGSNTVYAFTTNQQYTAGTTLALFGARVV